METVNEIKEYFLIKHNALGSCKDTIFLWLLWLSGYFGW